MSEEEFNILENTINIYDKGICMIANDKTTQEQKEELRSLIGPISHTINELRRYLPNTYDDMY